MNVLVERYFQEHLPQFTQKPLSPGADDITCSFGYRMSDVPAASWVLWLQNGVLDSFEHAAGPAQCWFNCNAQTFLDIASGVLPPQDAFFAKEVDIEGDLELGLMLSVILGPFFAQNPFHP